MTYYPDPHVAGVNWFFDCQGRLGVALPVRRFPKNWGHWTYSDVQGRFGFALIAETPERVALWVAMRLEAE